MKQVIEKLAWILVVDRRVLSSRSIGKDVYYLPGGKREDGESDVHALMREVKEELDVDVVESSIQYLGTFEDQAHGKPLDVVVRMICYKSDFVGEIKASSEIAEVVWLRREDRERSAPVDKQILDWLWEGGLID